MACGSCAAAARRRAGKGDKFVWTPPADSRLKSVEYDSELAAKAKVQRKGGSYALKITA